MQRRKFLLGAGSLAAAGAAATGTGAFTQIKAQRKVSGTVVKDPSAQVGLSASGQNKEHASIKENSGEIELDLSSLNPDSKTTLGGIFKITNNTGEKVKVYIKDNTSKKDILTFFKGDPPANPPVSIEGEGNAVQLGTSGSVAVGVQLNLDGKEKGFSFGSDDNFTVVATTGGTS